MTKKPTTKRRSSGKTPPDKFRQDLTQILAKGLRYPEIREMFDEKKGGQKR